MKIKIIVVALIIGSLNIGAQDTGTDRELLKTTELSTNLFDLVVAGSLNVNYERLFKNNQSLFTSVTFFDTYGYYDAGYIRESSAVTLKAAYFIYFTKNKDHEGFFFYPQLRLRTGKVTVEDYYYYDEVVDSTFENTYSYDVDGVGAGFGLGHKWLFSNKFTLTLNTEIARHLGNWETDYLDDIEFRVGVNFGYRF